MEEKEKKIWKDEHIIVFDTSALLDFYFFPKRTRENIYKNVFSELKESLWIPYHVYLEYTKNRKSVIKKPIKQSYSPLKDILKNVDKRVSNIENLYMDFHNRSKKADRLPYIDEKVTEKYSDLIKNFEDEVEKFNKKLTEEIEDAEEEIHNTIENDDHLEKVKEFFTVGRKYEYQELLEIVKEGELRYRNKLPPGYEDFSEKDGLQKFGDLILWKQILEHIQEKERNVIFITDDQKEDWLIKTKDGKYFPRFELELELQSMGGRNLWIYNQSDFLRTANEFINTKVEAEDILSIEEFLNRKAEYEETSFLKCKCENCGLRTKFSKDEIFIDWQGVGSYERGMGKEIEYEARVDLFCKYCDNLFEIIYRAWEYPMGALNYTDIESTGCEIIEFHFPDVPLNI